MLVTMVTKNRQPVFANSSRAREAIECLYRVQQLHPFFLYSFVVMPDHCHFLMRVLAPETISHIIGAYKSGLTFDLGIKQLWQPRFHIKIIHNINAAIHYIHMNPVRKKLIDRPEAYLWSSACKKWDIASFEAI